MALQYNLFLSNYRKTQTSLVHVQGIKEQRAKLVEYVIQPIPESQLHHLVVSTHFPMIPHSHLREPGREPPQ